MHGSYIDATLRAQLETVIKMLKPIVATARRAAVCRNTFFSVGFVENDDGSVRTALGTDNLRDVAAELDVRLAAVLQQKTEFLLAATHEGREALRRAIVDTAELAKETLLGTAYGHEIGPSNSALRGPHDQQALGNSAEILRILGAGEWTHTEIPARGRPPSGVAPRGPGVGTQS